MDRRSALLEFVSTILDSHQPEKVHKIRFAQSRSASRQEWRGPAASD